MEYKYDVAFSFAGEDREYVHRVAEVLQANGIRVFYDKFEEVDIWGKDLGIHFDYVYRRSARYCIPFISQHYQEKIWANYEIRTAISRAIEANVEYILPARFDDTQIEGIRPSLAYIDLRKYTPEEFADLIAKKVGGSAAPPIPEQEHQQLDNIYLGANVVMQGQRITNAVLRVSMTNIIKEFRYFNQPYFQLSHAFEDKSDSFVLLDMVVPVSFPVRLEYGQVADVSYLLNPDSKQVWEELPDDTEIRAVVSTTLGEKYESNPITPGNILRVLTPRGS